MLRKSQRQKVKSQQEQNIFIEDQENQLNTKYKEMLSKVSRKSKEMRQEVMPEQTRVSSITPET